MKREIIPEAIDSGWKSRDQRPVLEQVNIRMSPELKYRFQAACKSGRSKMSMADLLEELLDLKDAKEKLD
jgi:hypothetical protein